MNSVGGTCLDICIKEGSSSRESPAPHGKIAPEFTTAYLIKSSKCSRIAARSKFLHAQSLQAAPRPNTSSCSTRPLRLHPNQAASAFRCGGESCEPPLKPANVHNTNNNIVHTRSKTTVPFACSRARTYIAAYSPHVRQYLGRDPFVHDNPERQVACLGCRTQSSPTLKQAFV